MDDVLVRLSNITKIYGKNKVLNQLNLEFRKKKAYLLVGENGSGKTTILKVILGLISYEGERTITCNQIGYVPDSLHFPYYLTCYDFLYNLGLIKNMLPEKIKKALEILSKEWEIYPHINKKIHECSKGTKQKLLIIQAMLANPDIYIFDEALNGLDQNMQLKLFDFIQAMKDAGKTIIITSHYFSLYKNVVDQVIYLKEGKAYDQFN